MNDLFELLGIPIESKDIYLIIIVIILVMILVWLIIRELRCWYWKINDRVDLLSDIRDQLLELNSRVDINNKILLKNSETKSTEK